MGGGGDNVHVVKFIRGIMSTYTKMSRGVLSEGDIVLRDHSGPEFLERKYLTQPKVTRNN